MATEWAIPRTRGTWGGTRSSFMLAYPSGNYLALLDKKTIRLYLSGQSSDIEVYLYDDWWHAGSDRTGHTGIGAHARMFYFSLPDGVYATMGLNVNHNEGGYGTIEHSTGYFWDIYITPLFSIDDAVIRISD